MKANLITLSQLDKLIEELNKQKTIKELEAEEQSCMGCIYCKDSKCMKNRRIIKPLKDVVKLIDETMIKYGHYIDAEELKARIEG